MIESAVQSGIANEQQAQSADLIDQSVTTSRASKEVVSPGDDNTEPSAPIDYVGSQEEEKYPKSAVLSDRRKQVLSQKLVDYAEHYGSVRPRFIASKIDMIEGPEYSISAIMPDEARKCRVKRRSLDHRQLLEAAYDNKAEEMPLEETPNLMGSLVARLEFAPGVKTWAVASIKEKELVDKLAVGMSVKPFSAFGGAICDLFDGGSVKTASLVSSPLMALSPMKLSKLCTQYLSGEVTGKESLPNGLKVTCYNDPGNQFGYAGTIDAAAAPYVAAAYELMSFLELKVETELGEQVIKPRLVTLRLETKSTFKQSVGGVKIDLPHAVVYLVVAIMSGSMRMMLPACAVRNTYNSIREIEVLMTFALLTLPHAPSWLSFSYSVSTLAPVDCASCGITSNKDLLNMMEASNRHLRAERVGRLLTDPEMISFKNSPLIKMKQKDWGAIQRVVCEGDVDQHAMLEALVKQTTNDGFSALVAGSIASPDSDSIRILRYQPILSSGDFFELDFGTLPYTAGVVTLRPKRGAQPSQLLYGGVIDAATGGWLMAAGLIGDEEVATRAGAYQDMIANRAPMVIGYKRVAYPIDEQFAMMGAFMSLSFSDCDSFGFKYSTMIGPDLQNPAHLAKPHFRSLASTPVCKLVVDMPRNLESAITRILEQWQFVSCFRTSFARKADNDKYGLKVTADGGAISMIIPRFCPGADGKRKKKYTDIEVQVYLTDEADKYHTNDLLWFASLLYGAGEAEGEFSLAKWSAMNVGFRLAIDSMLLKLTPYVRDLTIDTVVLCALFGDLVYIRSGQVMLDTTFLTKPAWRGEMMNPLTRLTTKKREKEVFKLPELELVTEQTKDSNPLIFYVATTAMRTRKLIQKDQRSSVFFMTRMAVVAVFNHSVVAVREYVLEDDELVALAAESRNWECSYDPRIKGGGTEILITKQKTVSYGHMMVVAKKLFNFATRSDVRLHFTSGDEMRNLYTMQSGDPEEKQPWMETLSGALRGPAVASFVANGKLGTDVFRQARTVNNVMLYEDVAYRDNLIWIAVAVAQTCEVPLSRPGHMYATMRGLVMSANIGNDKMLPRSSEVTTAILPLLTEAPTTILGAGQPKFAYLGSLGKGKKKKKK